jgi:hypothetical protein
VKRGPRARRPSAPHQQVTDTDKKLIFVRSLVLGAARVNVDGAPTIFCFHASCAAAVVEANARLRRELAASPWELRLPGGETLRSGDVLQKDGTVVARPHPGPLPRVEGNAAELLILETLRVTAERFKAELFDFFSVAHGGNCCRVAFACGGPGSGGPVPDLGSSCGRLIARSGSEMFTAPASQSIGRISGR